MIRVAHRLKGRARFEVPGLRGSPGLATGIERELRGFVGIVRASASPLTGKVLVFFNEAETTEGIAVLLGRLYAELSGTARTERASGGIDAPGRSGGVSSRKGLHLPVRESAVAWHTVSPDRVVQQMETSPAAGLSESAVIERRARYGSNSLPGTATRPFFTILKNQVLSLPVVLTGVAAGLSALTGRVVEGLIVLGIAAVNSAVGSIAEARAERTLKGVRRSIRLRAEVLREGRIREIPFDDIVPGDVLDLQPGARIAADARIIQADSLAVDESALTGESMPAIKYPATLAHENVPFTERVNMVYRGTLVVEGTARAVVVASGRSTVLGKLQSFLGELFPPEALMARDIKTIAIHLIPLGLGACALLAATSLLRGHGLIRIAKDSLSLIAGAVPSGLSTLALSAFAFGHRDMDRNRILVRRMRALGSMASIQVVCFDKTGTLTHNQMTARALFTGDRRVEIEEGAFVSLAGETAPLRDPDVSWLLRVGALCNEAVVLEEKGDEFAEERSSTEEALLDLAELAGIDPVDLRKEHPTLNVVHRGEDRPFMVTVHSWEDRQLIAMKGNPLEVLERCSHYAKDGQILPLDDDVRHRIETENFKMARMGLRVLGAAYRVGRFEEERHARPDEVPLVWLGLVALEDPLRKEAKPLIEALHRAGIRTAVITGDQSLTAQHIGEELRLSEEAPLKILDSTDLRGLSQAAMRSIVTQAHVFARLGPTQKLQVIQAYQSMGLGVAMVGDGINDALALRVADVGMAMGKQGADLARTSADFVLEDDNLESVMVAIANGRAFFHNMRRSLCFVLGANHVDLLMGLLERSDVVGGGPSALQSLWINLLGLSLAVGAPGMCCMVQEPLGTEESILKSHVMADSLTGAAEVVLGAAATGAYGILRYGAGMEASRLFLQSASINQLLYSLKCRRKAGETIGDASPSRLFQLTLMGAVGGYLLAAVLPGVGRPFGELASRMLNVAALGAGALLSQVLLSGEKTNGALQSVPQTH